MYGRVKLCLNNLNRVREGELILENIAKQTKSKNFIYKILFIVYLLANLCLSIIRHYGVDYDNDGLDWQNIEMIMSYKFGFVRRGLMGTLALALSNIFGIDRHDAIVRIQYAGEIILCLLITVLIFYLISLCKNETSQNTVIFLSAVFIMLGGFGFYLYDWGEPDIYMASLTIIAVLLIVSKRCIFLVIPISCICEMIHEGYALMFFPVVFALLFYFYCKEDDKTKKKKYFVVLFLTTLFTAVLFFYFYFFSTPIVNYSEEEILGEFKAVYPKKLSDLLANNIKYIWLGAENYALPLWKEGKPTFIFFYRMTDLMFWALAVSPCLIYMLIIWLSRALNFKKNKHKWAELALFFSIIVVVPLFIVHSDIARWCYSLVFYEFVILSVITVKDEDYTVRFFEKNKWINNWFVKLVFVCIILGETYLITFDKWRIIDIERFTDAYHSVLGIFY